MFFVLSKILAFLISPINWIFAVAVYALAVRDRRRKKRAGLAAFLLFVIFTNGFLVNSAMGILEVQSKGNYELERDYGIGILLGGLIHYQSDTNLVNFNANGDRLFQAIDLYESGRVERLLISSGSGLFQLPSFREAYLIRKYLVGIGIPPEDILIETESRNTYENAVECRKIINGLPGSDLHEPVLLITSASHMRRAAGCFRKQGINVVPYSTTKRTERGRAVFHSEKILPDPTALAAWKNINHEWVGLLVYKLKGYL